MPVRVVFGLFEFISNSQKPLRPSATQRMESLAKLEVSSSKASRSARLTRKTKTLWRNLFTGSKLSVKITKAVSMTRWDKVLKKRVPMKMILLDVESDEGFKILTERGKVKLGCEVFPLEVFKPRERLPSRCFKCQRLGHVAKFCKGDETCMRCSEKVTDENKAIRNGTV